MSQKVKKSKNINSNNNNNKYKQSNNKFVKTNSNSSKSLNQFIESDSYPEEEKELNLNSTTSNVNTMNANINNKLEQEEEQQQTIPITSSSNDNTTNDNKEDELLKKENELTETTVDKTGSKILEQIIDELYQSCDEPPNETDDLKPKKTNETTNDDVIHQQFDSLINEIIKNQTNNESSNDVATTTTIDELDKPTETVEETNSTITTIPKETQDESKTIESSLLLNEPTTTTANYTNVVQVVDLNKSNDSDKENLIEKDALSTEVNETQKTFTFENKSDLIIETLQSTNEVSPLKKEETTTTHHQETEVVVVETQEKPEQQKEEVLNESYVITYADDANSNVEEKCNTQLEVETVSNNTNVEENINTQHEVEAVSTNTNVEEKIYTQVVIEPVLTNTNVEEKCNTQILIEPVSMNSLNQSEIKDDQVVTLKNEEIITDLVKEAQNTKIEEELEKKYENEIKMFQNMIQADEGETEEKPRKVEENKKKSRSKTYDSSSNRLVALTGIGLALSLGVIAVAKFKRIF